MNEPQLLIEHWGQPGECIDGVPMLESHDGTDSGLAPGLYIEGIFMQAEVVNRNKRLYPKRILEKAVSNYIKEQVVTKQALGELNHPPRANVDPMQAAIIIEDMWWKGNDVYGRARIIEGDHGPGDKLAANIRAGWIPGVSSRGLGSLTETNKGYKIVNEGFKLTVGVDAVWGPSAPDAWVTPKQISESHEAAPAVAKKSADEAFKALTESLKAL
ncbi:head maturation protease [Citrobacter phage Moon]|uniref:Prohead core scaffold protein n=3 Tax=Moonvirus TaxID=1985329 RepID=A0A0K1LMT6_9CAUD|nr:head maturation protease [Citrobacter phage Moon]YP_009203909.1 head maturation protease [Citrobacter phage Merlin]YP_009618253.1 head maturation protease [Citrobacter phage CF1 ERZ-2017]YP_010844076.1 head maturation protease [Salmonella phage KM16]AIX12162.1 prohead core scaffolding protein and protease [Citrobacter phage Moon]AKU43841.1 prohead core scaffold protein [Citrobacter phage Merlin]AUE23067.1 prohead core scaffold protein [Citrobacter phage CF1 ERZ-2017]